MTPIKIGPRLVGDGHEAYVIAELSGNHGGDIEKAIALLNAADEAGADAIKLQVYRPDTITLQTDKPDFQIPKKNAWEKYENLYQLYEYAHTPWEWLPRLFEEAEKRGVALFGSVFDETSVDELEKFPCPAYKIASPEIVDMALLEKVAKTGKPVIVSTGLANLSEVADAVSHLKTHGCRDIILLKCTTAYPTPPEEVHLSTIENLKQTFDCQAGLSDHTAGIGVSIAAVALGASVIEKHIKLDDGEETVDSFFSLSISEFQQMVREIRNAQKAIGHIHYDLTPEAAKNKNGKRSLYISAPVKKGDILGDHNIKSVRPGFGLPPKFKDQIMGRKAKVDLEVGDRLSWDVVD